MSDYHARRFAVAIILWCCAVVCHDLFMPDLPADGPPSIGMDVRDAD